MIYVRTFPPLPAEHLSATHPCPACDEPCGTSLPVVLVAVGPLDQDARADHDAGRWYSAGVLLHEPCADRLDDDELEQLVGELIVISGGR